MRMFANKIGDDKFRFIFPSEVQVKLCFADLKQNKGSIVEVEVTEIKKVENG